MSGLLRLDEPVAAHRVPSSFAKKKTAAFKISRSSLKTLFSCLSLLSSSRSWVLSPSRSPRSISACLIQLRKVWCATRQIAYDMVGRPLRRGAGQLNPFGLDAICRPGDLTRETEGTIGSLPVGSTS